MVRPLRKINLWRRENIFCPKKRGVTVLGWLDLNKSSKFRKLHFLEDKIAKKFLIAKISFTKKSIESFDIPDASLLSTITCQ